MSKNTTNKKKTILNLPNKITLARIFLSVIIIIILVLPFDMLGVKKIELFINEKLVIDIKYIVAGVLFIIASFSVNKSL